MKKGTIVYLIHQLEILFWEYSRMSEKGKEAYRNIERVVYQQLDLTDNK